MDAENVNSTAAPELESEEVLIVKITTYSEKAIHLLKSLTKTNPLMQKKKNKGRVAQLIAGNELRVVYQPLVNLSNGTVYAHEALIRGPVESALHSPDDLFRAATKEDNLVELEIACAIKALEGWSELGCPGVIFINISAPALEAIFSKQSIKDIELILKHFNIEAKNVILEITEHEYISDLNLFIKVANVLLLAGIRFALDDFGDGFSSLRLWAEFTPKYVKIDKYFIKNVCNDPVRERTIRALIQIAQNFNTSLVAEGIESAQDLVVLRDLGIFCGQGYFLGRPENKPIASLPIEASKYLTLRSC